MTLLLLFLSINGTDRNYCISYMPYTGRFTLILLSYNKKTQIVCPYITHTFHSFHTEMSFMSAMSKRLEESNIEDVPVKAGIIAQA